MSERRNQQGNSVPGCLAGLVGRFLARGSRDECVHTGHEVCVCTEAGRALHARRD